MYQYALATVCYLGPLMICVSCTLGWSAASGDDSVNRTLLIGDRDAIPSVTWKETTSEEKWRIVAMLHDHLSSNYASIRSWKGAYRVRGVEGQPASFLKSMYANGLNGRDVTNVELERSFTMTFAIDMQGERIFREKKTDLMYWRDMRTEEQFSIPNTAPSDERSFVAGEEYTHFDPKASWPEFDYLVSNPEAQNKRAAFREPAEKGERKHYGDLLDPRDFFGYAPGIPMSKVLSNFLSVNLASAEGKQLDQSIKIFECDEGGCKLYRLNGNIPTGHNSNDSVLHSDWVFDGSVGFHMTGYVTRRENEPNMQEIKWRWKNVDGVFVPGVVFERFVASGAQTMELWRESELEECTINVPLAPDQFSLSGLGLEEGELVIDKINRAVEIFRDGKTARLGAFGDQYVPPPQQTLAQSPIRIIVIGLNLLVLVIGVGWMMRRRKLAS